MIPDDTLIAVPVYNEASQLARFLAAFRRIVPAERAVFVDDGSRDATPQILAQSGYTTIRQDRNRGKGAALQAALAEAQRRGIDWLVTLDADLQHSPDNILDLIESRRPNYLTIGSRNVSLRTMPPARWLSNTLTSLVLSIATGHTITDSQSGFRLLPVAPLAGRNYREDGFAFESELLLHATDLGLGVASVPIPTIYNGATSSINHVVDTGRFCRVLLRHLWS